MRLDSRDSHCRCSSMDDTLLVFLTRCWCFCTGWWYIGQLFVVSSQASWWVLFDVGSKQMSNIPSLSAPCWSRRWLLCPDYKTEGCVLRNPACYWPSWRSCQCASSKKELSEGQPLDILLSLQSWGCVLSACMGVWWEIWLDTLRTLHFWGWNAMPHLASHSAKASRSCCRAAQSLWSLTGL